MSYTPQRTQILQGISAFFAVYYFNTWRLEIGKWNPYVSLSSAVV